MLWVLVAWGERLVSLAAIVVLSPLLVLVAAAVNMASGRSPLVAHRRMGRHGVPFWMLKFRTMWGGNGERSNRFTLVSYVTEEPGPRLKSPRDPRVPNGFASFLRRYSVDEMPQLLHVVTGRMALVGPRPITRSELDLHYGSAAAEVLAVRPGLTGLWQVMGRSHLGFQQRRRLDLYLVRHWSLRLYAAILLRTAPAVLAGKNAW